MDAANRIKYDEVRGMWKVIHGGKELTNEFKSSGEAFKHLQTLTPKK
jgi:hypothetical protein